MNIDKEKVAGVLSQVGPALRALSEENQQLRVKVAEYIKKERIEKIASRMEVKNLNPDSSREDKIQQLFNESDLDVIEKAVELSATQVKLAELSDSRSGSTLSDFESALLSDD